MKPFLSEMLLEKKVNKCSKTTLIPLINAVYAPFQFYIVIITHSKNDGKSKMKLTAKFLKYIQDLA